MSTVFKGLTRPALIRGLGGSALPLSWNVRYLRFAWCLDS